MTFSTIQNYFIARLRLHKSLILVVLILLGTIQYTIAQGQATALPYYRAQNVSARLSNSGNYEAAFQIWSDLNAEQLNREQHAHRAFQLAYLGLQANHPVAAKAMRQFVQDFPEAIELSRAYSLVGEYYFSKAQYANALAWYEEAENRESFSSKHQFEMGYAHFKLGHTASARALLLPLAQEGAYRDQSLYCLGFMDYQNGEWSMALSRLEKIGVDQRDDLQTWSLMADLSLRLGDYTRSAVQGMRALDAMKISGKMNSGDLSAISGIIGRSYALLGAYPTAIDYLEQACEMPFQERNKMIYAENNFFLGQAYFEMGKPQRAIDQLSRISQPGHLGPEIAYVLGGAYLALDRKTQALNAFKRASQVREKKELSAEAHFQYAKLTFDLKLSYTSVPEVLDSFIKAYPEDSRRKEVEQWWLSALLQEKNYQAVIEYLHGEGKDPNGLSQNQRDALQRAFFFKGLSAYQGGSARQAMDDFNRSHSLNEHTLLAARATYWRAVMFNESGAFDSALKLLLKLKAHDAFQHAPEGENGAFELGYAYMGLKDYTGAQKAFESFLNQSESVGLAGEARLNLADSYFATKAYSDALGQYNLIVKENRGSKDYADFQAAICLGFTSGTAAKIQRLNDFILAHPDSIYLDEVYFALASSYVVVEQFDLAKERFAWLVQHEASSSLIALAKLNLGLLEDNEGHFELALTYFKEVVQAYPESEQAISAVQAARNSYIALGRVQQYAQWVEGLDFISVEEASLDQASFESAKQALTEGRIDLATDRFENYLVNYPSGTYGVEAHHHLSEIYWQKQDEHAAIIHSEIVARADNSALAIPSLIRMARHHLTSQKPVLAMPILRRLLEQPIDRDQKSFALSNLTQLAQQDGQWTETKTYSEELMNLLDAETQAYKQAQLVNARSYFELDDYSEAELRYQGLDQWASGEQGAQLLYARAYFAHLDQHYAQSNELIQNLAQNYASYSIYGAKGLLLMGLNFENMNDFFQARFIWQNILDNMNEFPEIQAQAQDLLKALNEKEQSTKDSMPKEENNQSEQN